MKQTSHQWTAVGSTIRCCNHSVGVCPKKTKRSKSIIVVKCGAIPIESASPRV